MAIGAALASNKKTLCLVGDGGLQVNLGELATLVQEQADVLVVLMNDRGYGVIRNIWDAQYGGRRAYSDLHTPDFATLAQSIGLPFHRVRERAKFQSVLQEAATQRGPALVEVDMTAIGPYAKTFAGPPVRKVEA
jgi:acetolactate synthase-1/2/3 large subunit